jgi:hypothetical protein
MTSRERVELALEHCEADRVPLDLGATPTTGMHVSSVYKLRQALELDPPRTPVKVIEPYQMLGEIADDLLDALAVDVVGLGGPVTMFGFRNEHWREWTTFDGTPVLVPEGFNTEPDENGDILMYPEGDRTVPPSGRMPQGGFYFDSITRQEPIDDEHLNVEDNLEEFAPASEELLQHLSSEAERLRSTSDRAIVANFGGTAFGDIALVPGPMLKHPKGIRDVAEWYMSTAMRRDYIREVFARQCEIALGDLPRFYEAVGQSVSVVFMTGTDFGTQNAPFISKTSYCELYKPYHRALNDWVHAHTGWKTFMHSCGCISPLLDEFIDAGFDIVNPVQTTAAEMDARMLKERFGDRVVFWGGGVDTQHVLPFGTPDAVRENVRANIEALAPGGGFVFNTIHNLQAGVPVENIRAMYEAVREFGTY